MDPPLSESGAPSLWIPRDSGNYSPFIIHVVSSRVPPPTLSELIFTFH